jgi:hypothetical protein
VQAERALDVVEDQEVGHAMQQSQSGRRPPAGQPVLGHAGAEGDRPPVGQAAERRGVAHAQGHPGVELLPDAGDGEEHRRGHLADVLGHRVDALGEVHGGAGTQGVEDRERALGDVRQRQERELLVARARLGREVRVAELEQDVAVAQHRPLGRPGGAGGVDEDGQVLGLGDLDHPIERARVLAVVAGAQLEQRREVQHLRIAEAVQALQVVHDDLDELPTAGADLQDLVELLLVLGEEEAGAAVVDDVLDLARRVGRVDPVGDPAHREGAEIGVEPLGTVVGDDRHHVAGAETEGDETEAGVARALAVLAPADRAPDPQVLLAHGDPVAALAHHVPEEGGQRGLSVHGEAAPGVAHRHIFLRFQRRVPRTPVSLMPR